MSKLGYQLFGASPEWLAKLYSRRFGRTILAILREDPEQSDSDAWKALMDWFEPEALRIDDPVITTMTWATERIRCRDGRMDDLYLHEAQLPFSGTPELWRLVGSPRYQFTTRVSSTTKLARLRAYRPDQDVERFRASVVTDLANARLHATGQGPAIDAFRRHLHSHVEQCCGHEDLGALRAYARELKEQDDRLKQLGKI